MENAIDFWNKLNHNWKKIILVNYDFNKRFNKEFKKIDDLITYKGVYNAYYSVFNLRIRIRLDEFDANEDSINQLLKIDYFVLRYSGITDLNTLKHFSNLEYLSISHNIETFNQN